MHSDHEKEGFDLGWDIARLGYTVFDDKRIAACVAKGIAAGHAHFGRVPTLTCRYQRKVLQARLGAHWRGVAFSVKGVTADFIKAIDVKYCPITRELLTHSTGSDSDWSLDRIDNRLGYVVGNVAIMSTGANREKNALDFRGLARRAFDHTMQPKTDGALTAESWQRLWTLSAFTVPQADVTSWPMVMIPPYWVALTEPWTTKMFISTIADFGLPNGRMRDVLDGKKELRAMAAFTDAKQYANHRAITTLSRQMKKPRSEVARWATEDAWREQLVNITYHNALKEISSASKQRINQQFAPIFARQRQLAAESGARKLSSTLSV